MSNLEKKSVLRVINILSELGHTEQVVPLSDSARSALEASKALGVPVGAIVKTLIFTIQNDEGVTPIVCLVSGDMLCDTSQISQVLSIDGKVKRPDANTVKDITGYSIGGVSPIGLPEGIAIIMDSALARFDKIWSAAGHTHCVFPATFGQLKALTDALISDSISFAPNE